MRTEQRENSGPPGLEKAITLLNGPTAGAGPAMSFETLGMNDVTEEMQAFKDKLASKDAQIAAQQNQLLKKAAEFEELQATLNDALHKANFQNEKIACQNATGAFQRAQDTVKAKELEARELEAALDSLSRNSDDYNSRYIKVEREKATLEARVRELESNVRQFSAPPVTPAKAPRARSSSVSNLKISTLEYELSDVRGTLSQKEADLQTLAQKFESAQRELTQISNEKMALDSRMRKQIQELEDTLEEKEDELRFLKGGHDHPGREEELLRRIEEDEAKIEALEKLAGDASQMRLLKQKLAVGGGELKTTNARLAEMEARNVELVAEKEQALDDLEEGRAEIATLTRDLRAKDAQMEVLKSNSGSATQSDAQTVADMERLLAAVDRLRGERDGLRRDLEFLEMESRFTIAALEAKVSTLSDSNDDSMDIDPPAQHSVASSSTSSRPLEALAIVVDRLQFHIDSLESQLDTIIDSQKEKDTHLHDLQNRLEETTCRRNDLLSKMQTDSSEWQAKLEQSNKAHQETKDALDQLDVQLSEANAALEEVESERSSLHLQVTNLTSELSSVQNELAQAESRYSSLQFNQLSNMSSTEATRALRRQIEELEGRVLRRNEQIGIHQHDVKRLETNIKLQEERLVEMTTEMETLCAQKDAMVEDCADAREARDDAIARVDKLEEEIERLEELQEEKEQALTAVVGVVFHTVDCSRRKISSAEQRRKETVEGCEILQRQHDSKCDELTLLTSELDNTKHRLTALLSDHRKTTAELTASQDELSRRSSSSQDLENARIGLVQMIDELQQQLANRASEASSLASQLEMLRNEHSSDLEQHTTRINELQREVNDLQGTISRKEAEHQGTVSELRRHLTEKDELLANNDVETELVQLKMKHVEEVGQLQSQLVEANALLEETKARYGAAEVDHQQSLADASEARKGLEREKQGLLTELAQLKELQENLAEAREGHTQVLDEFRAQVSHLSEELQSTQQSRDELDTAHQRIIAELGQSRSDNEVQLQKLRDEVEQLRCDLVERSTSLEQTNDRIATLEARLRKEGEERSKDRSLHEEEIQALEERHQEAESLAHRLSQQVVSIQGQLESADKELELLQEEKNVHQRDMTAREAEVQRYLSLNRYLENQFKESERTISSLRSEIQQTTERLARVEKASSSAEVNLTLQTGHHKREVSQLQQEIKSLKSKPNFEPVVRELEERINEMEELLKRKCEEIEKHDDQTYEIMKENKGLKTKVESLTRKTHNLQTKLAAAKASIQSGEKEARQSPPATLMKEDRQRLSSLTKEDRRSPPVFTKEDRPSAPSTFTVSPTAPAVPQLPPGSRSRSAIGSQADAPVPRPRHNTLSTLSSPPVNLTPSGSSDRSRVASGPSALPRPKTPERKGFLQPVFRAMSPKKKDSDPDLPAQTAGKKRRTPEDFEDCESVPPQAFTSDSLPEDTSTTPKARRVLTSIQSGFTPVRNQTRPIVPLPSPKRFSLAQAPEPDFPMSHSNPRVQSMSHPDMKPSKSWLGKIRGASAATSRSKLV
ncbi:hypothetical protein D9758_002180 [Tetrapyrgos nigripes]|uniref:Uncharacterized protein n=1 Tax=Tetrapyrgos nigripes TaxID=182062 RepID=A0A8H5GP89_9AGAR|nr:hypothetical protein D9758_002180 [Tetrapyrgos nigripes]